MKCPNCYREIPSDSKFCPDCGQKIEKSKEITSEEIHNKPLITHAPELLIYIKCSDCIIGESKLCDIRGIQNVEEIDSQWILAETNQCHFIIDKKDSVIRTLSYGSETTGFPPVLDDFNVRSYKVLESVLSQRGFDFIQEDDYMMYAASPAYDNVCALFCLNICLGVMKNISIQLCTCKEWKEMKQEVINKKLQPDT